VASPDHGELYLGIAWWDVVAVDPVEAHTRTENYDDGGVEDTPA
jgi:hypothetical protein